MASIADIKYEIIEITKPCKDFCVVSLIPPYREFPNIIIFKLDKEDKWKRIFECLSVGIQDNRSDFLDLHTIGRALDTGEDNQIYDFNSKKIRDLIKISQTTDGIIIPYQHFFHTHFLTEKGEKEFYTIDKTQYFDLAREIVGKQYEKYPKNQCTMYDTPKIKDIELSYQGSVYEINAMTDNGQLWKITFKDVDEEYKFLLEKTIEAKIALSK